MLKNQIRKDKKLRGNQRLSPLVFMLCNYDKFVKRNTAFHQKNILKYEYYFRKVLKFPKRCPAM